MSRPRLIVAFLADTLRRFLRDGCTHRSAAIAYFALLSSGPALILGVRVLSPVTGSSPEGRRALLSVLSDLLPPGQESVLEDLVQGLHVPQSLVALLIPVLVWTALLVFVEVEQAVSAIFRRPEPQLFRHTALKSTLKSFALLVLCGAVLVGTFLFHNVLVALAASGSRPAFRLLPLLGTWLVPPISTLVVFSFVYWVLPPVRVRGKHALVGGITAAALWEAMKHLYGMMASRAPTYGLFYGPLSLLVITLVWAYLSAAILLLGAEAVALKGESWSRERGT